MIRPALRNLLVKFFLPFLSKENKYAGPYRFQGIPPRILPGRVKEFPESPEGTHGFGFGFAAGATSGTGVIFYVFKRLGIESPALSQHVLPRIVRGLYICHPLNLLLIYWALHILINHCGSICRYTHGYLQEFSERSRFHMSGYTFSEDKTGALRL